jgi:hypothetical protein
MSRHRFATDNESLCPAIDMRLLQFYTSKGLADYPKKIALSTSRIL